MHCLVIILSQVSYNTLNCIQRQLMGLFHWWVLLLWMLGKSQKHINLTMYFY